MVNLTEICEWAPRPGSCATSFETTYLLSSPNSFLKSREPRNYQTHQRGTVCVPPTSGPSLEFHKLKCQLKQHKAVHSASCPEPIPELSPREASDVLWRRKITQMTLTLQQHVIPAPFSQVSGYSMLKTDYDFSSVQYQQSRICRACRISGVIKMHSFPS